jgi:hypothetical protein
MLLDNNVSFSDLVLNHMEELRQLIERDR